jgi:transglutaminase-like putative cysteine protease
MFEPQTTSPIYETVAPMKHLERLSLALAVTSFLAAGPAGADEPIDTRTVYRHETVEVQADGRSIDTLEHAEQLITEKAAREYAQVTLGYKPTMADFTVIEAYTLKKDGRRIPVAAKMIQEQRGQVGSLSAASFDDSASTIIIFPDTQAGDTTVYKARWTGTKTLLPGSFWMWRSFQDTWLVADYRLTLVAPERFPMHVKTLEMDAPKEEVSAGSHRWTWTHHNDRKGSYERAGLHSSQRGPRFFVSSFGDYAELARAQQRLWMDKTEVTPALQALADRLTRGKAAPEEKARKIYDWVRENIRYVAVMMDTGGWEPHKAGEILERGSGDCKDHAVLLDTLLKAAGIASTPALIHTGELRAALEPPQAEFNHVITYIPALDTYVDSTETHAPYGVLPAEDRARPVLHLKLGQGLHYTPADDERTDTLTSRTRYELHEDGSVDATQELLATGSREIELRRWFGGFNEYSKKNWVRDRLIGQGVLGEGSIESLDGGEDNFRVVMKFHARNYFNPAAMVALDASAWHQFSPLVNSFAKYAGSSRETPYVCGAYRERQQITMVFPSAWRPELPAARTLSVADRSFQVSYAREGNSVQVTRDYVSSVRGEICASARYAEEKPFFENVMRDLRSQILFAAPPATAENTAASAAR